MATLRTCVVCGAQSHRDDWINTFSDEVACDSHSKDEVKKGVSAKVAKVKQAEEDAAQKAALKTPVPAALPAASHKAADAKKV